MKLRTAIALVAFTLAPACAPGDGIDPSEAQSATEAVVLRAGIAVDARYHHAFRGTPTYGSTPDAYLRLQVTVHDGVVRRDHPRFDGFEAPFARVPRAVGGRVLWESVPLRYVGTSPAGYYGQERVDRYELATALVIDLPTVRRLGVAVGLDTNVGDFTGEAPSAYRRRALGA